jgi:hypothetical protein
MKKVLALLITVLFLTSGFNISISRNLFGDLPACVEISFSGEKRMGGMEQLDFKSNYQTILIPVCCRIEILSIYGNEDYFPEHFQISKLFPVKHLAYYYDPFAENNLKKTKLYYRVFPPGESSFSGSSQSDICVYLI